MADEEKLKLLIKEVASEQSFTDYSLDIIPISFDGAHYTSKVYKVIVREGCKVLNLFAKVASIRRINSEPPQIYKTEIYAYTRIVEIYGRLQEECEVPDMDRLKFTKLYASNPNDDETVILEDLTARGYKSFDRLKSVDWPQGSAAVQELAKLHALSFACGLSNPEEFEEILKEVFDLSMNNENRNRYFEKTIETAIETVTDENKEKLKRFFKICYPDNCCEWRKPSKMMVLGHGDYRISNLMYKECGDGSVDIKIVDLQTLQGCSPMVDLLYFIFTGSDQCFRTQYFDRLVEHYYTELSAAMTRLRLQPELVYSRKDFYHELKEKLPLGLALAVFTLPLLTAEVQHAPRPGEEVDLTAFSVRTTSALYAARLNEAVEDYVRWGVLV